jgi:uncharacterized membrane protein
MLPRALIGEIKPENWLGFIDAIYAIILTLLLIELPSAILALIKEYELHPNLHWALLNSFTLSLFGYLSTFIIVYDIWAHHRVVVVEATLRRVNLSMGILILFLCSLLPPMVHVVSVIEHEYMTGESNPAGAYSIVFWDAKLAVYLTTLSVYGCITLIAAKDLRFFRQQGGEAGSRVNALKQLKDSGLTMVIVIVVVCFLSLKEYIHPPTPIVAIALCTHLPVDKLLLQLKRLILPH